MSRNTIVILATGALMAYAGSGRADIWDPADNTRSGTRNELVKGSEQLHDLGSVLGGADEDWYRVSIKPYSSYEVLVDSTSRNIGPTLVLELTDSSGGVLTSSVGVSSQGYSRSLRFYNDTGTVIDNRYLHVKSGSCTTGCTTSDVYRIRMVETTLPMVRFNNVSTQVTYLFLDNAVDYGMNAEVAFLDIGGSLICQTSLLSLPARTQAIFDDDQIYIGGCTPGVDCNDICPGVSFTDQAGHAMVFGDYRFGDLMAKGAAIDVGTGWEFDTEMPARPY